MRVNEVKKVKKIEEVIRTEYVAEDGQIFSSEQECEKYEKSALFAISSQLKRMTENISQNDIDEGLSCDDMVEIFNIQTERDLENLRRYLYLKARQNGASEEDIYACFSSKSGKRDQFVLENVTIGHEVMIFWNYDENWFWVYGDGSIDGYCNFFKDRITNLISNEKIED